MKIAGMCTGLNYERFEVFGPGKPYMVFEVHVGLYAPSTMKVETVCYSETFKLPRLQCFISKKSTVWFDKASDKIGWPTSLLSLHLKTGYFESMCNCSGM
jgi:hypothetical protein